MKLIYIGDSRNVITRLRSNHCSGNVEGSRLRQCIAKRMGYGFKITKRSNGSKNIRIDLSSPRVGEQEVSSYIRSGKWKYVLCNSYDKAHDFQWYAIDKLDPMLNANCRPWKQINRNRYQKLLEMIGKSPEYSCEELKKLKTGPGVYVFYHKREPSRSVRSGEATPLVKEV